VSLRKPVEESTVGIVGLGLMGGAAALALRNKGLIGPAGRLLACDLNPACLDQARAEGVIDEGFREPEPMLGRCDLVFLCLNPTALLAFMDRYMAAFRSGALLADVAGLKAAIVRAMERRLRPDLDFIPGHPMAGAEKGGYANARLCSFEGRNYILTPLARNKPENLVFFKALIRRMGFSRITEATGEEHDRKIAFTSELCHLIGAALIDCEPDAGITRFGGGSFEDLTRIAMLNAPMWSELFLENRGELLACLGRFEGSLNQLKRLIAAGDREGLERRLNAVRERRIAMNG
jgi:prephenate dehydrogenase